MAIDVKALEHVLFVHDHPPVVIDADDLFAIGTPENVDDAYLEDIGA